MKKILVLVSVLFVFGVSAHAKRMPEFDDNPDAYVIDVRDLKDRVDEQLRVVNQTNSDAIGFRVYAFDKDDFDWVIYGSTEFKKIGKNNKVKSTVKDVDKYRFFAIEATDGVAYSYSAQVDKNNNLVITALPKRE